MDVGTKASLPWNSVNELLENVKLIKESRINQAAHSPHRTSA